MPQKEKRTTKAVHNYCIHFTGAGWENQHIYIKARSDDEAFKKFKKTPLGNKMSRRDVTISIKG